MWSLRLCFAHTCMRSDWVDGWGGEACVALCLVLTHPAINCVSTAAVCFGQIESSATGPFCFPPLGWASRPPHSHWSQQCFSFPVPSPSFLFCVSIFLLFFFTSTFQFVFECALHFNYLHTKLSLPMFLLFCFLIWNNWMYIISYNSSSSVNQETWCSCTPKGFGILSTC